MIRVFIIVILVGTAHLCYPQVYTEKQTRHRFAQLNLGLDFQSGLGGSTRYSKSTKLPLDKLDPISRILRKSIDGLLNDKVFFGKLLQCVDEQSFRNS